MNANAPRKPRFRRVPTPRFEITDRDIEILRQVQYHRFLRSSHITQLIEGSDQGILRRLELLYHNHFLDRPRAQIDYHGRGGSKPMVYGLGNAGADLLARELGVPREKVDWTSKNRTVKVLFLEHTLLTADVMVGLELACRASGRVRVIPADEIVAKAPQKTRTAPNPVKWSVPVRQNGSRSRIGVIPDQFFGLEFLDEPKGGNRAYFFLEADRGTMPVERKTLDRTSFFRKLLAYHETWRQELHTQLFGIKNFRVLTVTGGPGRVHNLIEAAQKATRGKALRMFLFLDRDTVTGGDLLDVHWLDGKAQPTTLRD